MDIGKLRHRVSIQTYDEDESGTYETTKTYTTINTVYACIEAVKGLVTFDTKQIGEAVTHKITIRYIASITAEHWMLFGTRRFRIRSVRNLDERNRYLELLCEEDSTT